MEGFSAVVGNGRLLVGTKQELSINTDKHTSMLHDAAELIQQHWCRSMHKGMLHTTHVSYTCAVCKRAWLDGECVGVKL